MCRSCVPEASPAQTCAGAASWRQLRHRPVPELRPGRSSGTAEQKSATMHPPRLNKKTHVILGGKNKMLRIFPNEFTRNSHELIMTIYENQ